MGAGNANQRGGVDRPEVAQVSAPIPTRKEDEARLDEEAFAVKSYRVDTCVEEKEMRLCFFGEHGQRRLLGYLTVDSPEAYEFASLVLKNYDKLEGIK